MSKLLSKFFGGDMTNMDTTELNFVTAIFSSFVHMHQNHCMQCTDQ